ncbi:MAG: hypothetical protein ILO36_03550 [Abditibacteriota bacterium]|nr:hypothetical protein [Abditibacteriota bacterium]
MNSLTPRGGCPDLRLCFESGQAFGWEFDGKAWQGVAGESFYRLFTENGVLFWEAEPETAESEEFLKKYLCLDGDAGRIYRALEEKDADLAPLLREYRGLRVLAQPAEEVFFSFMASCCNNIPRIKAGLGELRELCGEPVCEREGRVWKLFPSAAAIAARKEEELTSIKGLAFRGRNMLSASRSLPEDFFQRLKRASYPEAKALLCSQKFIGEKLADCICLFGLGFSEAVPVDTHVYQIGVKRFGIEPRKSITSAVYKQTADAFRSRYGKYAGWAQQFLFMKEIDGYQG